MPEVREYFLGRLVLCGVQGFGDTKVQWHWCVAVQTRLPLVWQKNPPVVR